jgi:hypothetical protein
MSGNALKRLGIGDLTQEPTVGVLVKLAPKTFLEVKKQLQPILASMGDKGVWTTGGAGSWDPEHPFAQKGTTKIESGDVDVWMDSDLVGAALGLPQDAKESEVRKALAAAMSEQFPTTQIGQNVHIGVPTGHEIDVPDLGQALPAYFQVDLMVAKHAHDIAKHHEHDYSRKDSPYKGVDQQLAMASLVNTIPGYPERTFQYAGMQGTLKRRDTGEVVTRDINKIAKLVLGANATAADLGSADSIIDAVGGIDSPRLAQFRADMAKKQGPANESAPVGSASWFSSLKGKLAI